MVLTSIAVAAGLVLGVLRGGRPSALLRVPVRWWLLLPAGLALQVAGERGGPDGARWALVVAGMALLLAWALRNALVLPGATVVAVGLAANLAPVLANGHVPVRWEALVAVDRFEADQRGQVRHSGLYRLEDPTTRLPVLGDIVPVPVVDEVVSFGDLVVLAGLVVLSANLLLIRRRGGLSPEQLFADATPAAEPIARERVLDVREPMADGAHPVPGGPRPPLDGGGPEADWSGRPPATAGRQRSQPAATAASVDHVWGRAP